MADKTKLVTAASLAGAVALAISAGASLTPAAAQANEKCYGISLAGRTDRAIVTDVLRSMGLEPTADAVLELRAAYLDHLAIEIRKPVADSA